jgi:hypothetical protein
MVRLLRITHQIKQILFFKIQSKDLVALIVWIHLIQGLQGKSRTLTQFLKPSKLKQVKLLTHEMESTQL